MISPYSDRNVLTAVQELMRTDGLAVTLSAIARRSGTSRNFLYSGWKSLEVLQQRALTAEVMNIFNDAEYDCPRYGTVAGVIAHLVHIARTVRRHPTTAAVARTSPATMANAFTVMDGPLPDAVYHRLRNILDPLWLEGRGYEPAAVDDLVRKILWVARPAALCPRAAGDEDRERMLDFGLGLLLADLLPADPPPADPPAELLPADQPPSADQPSAESQLADPPLADPLPAELLPAELLPAEPPSAESQPADQPLADPLPAEPPSAESQPADQPLADPLPAELLPAEPPSADQPPSAELPPAGPPTAAAANAGPAAG